MRRADVNGAFEPGEPQHEHIQGKDPVTMIELWSRREGKPAVYVTNAPVFVCKRCYPTEDSVLRMFKLPLTTDLADRIDWDEAVIVRASGRKSGRISKQILFPERN